MLSVPQVTGVSVALVAPGQVEYTWDVPDLTGLYSVTGGVSGFLNYGAGRDLEAAPNPPEQSVVAGPILTTDVVLAGQCLAAIDPGAHGDVTCFVHLSGYDEPLRYDPDNTWTPLHESHSRSDPFVLTINGGAAAATGAAPVKPKHGKGKGGG